MLDKKFLIKNLSFSFITKVIAYLIQIAVLIISTRLFSPNDFGLIAITLTLTQFFIMLGDLGLGPAIISEKKIIRIEKNTLFSFSLLISIILTFFYLCSSILFIHIYNQPYFIYFGLFLAPGVFFSILCMVPLALLRKNCSFLLIGIIEIVAEVFSLFMMLITWKYGFDIYSLLIRIVSNSILKFIAYYFSYLLISKHLLTLNLKFKLIKKYFSFSVYQSVYGIIIYLSKNIDNLLIGKFFGTSFLGYYDRAYQLMRYPVNLTSVALGPVIQSILSKNQQVLIKTHNYLSFLLASLGCLICFILFANSKLIILILFGENWLPVVNYIEIFSFSIPILLLHGTSGAYFQAISKTKELLKTGCFSLLINTFILLLTIMLDLDILTLSKMLVLGYYFTAFYTYNLLYKESNQESLYTLFKSIWLPFFILSISIILYYLICYININNIIIINTPIILFFYLIRKIKTNTL